MAEDLKIWVDSGLFDTIGGYPGGAVMARNGDEGPYRVGNVSIQPFTVNLSDARAKSARLAAERRHTKNTLTVTFKK